jgi:hypothetical protein
MASVTRGAESTQTGEGNSEAVTDKIASTTNTCCSRACAHSLLT